MSVATIIFVDWMRVYESSSQQWLFCASNTADISIRRATSKTIFAFSTKQLNCDLHQKQFDRPSDQCSEPDLASVGLIHII